ncbi:MAG: hypothetical protein PHT50_06195 [Candidatus Omnitrophica bacterium]|nr:hypothetical protein [Candidatus Omnitrophota bacterium]
MAKRMFSGFLMLCMMFSVIFCQAAYSEDEGILSKLNFEVSGDLNFSSIYMWRGIMLDGDPVIQPGFYVSTPESKFGRIKAGIWVSHDLENKDALRSSETDYIIDYTYSFPSVDLSLGHTYYEFPDAVPSDGAPKGFSREFYAGFTLSKVFLCPSVYYYYDYGKKDDGGGEGSYTVLNLSYSKPFTVKDISMSLDLSGHAGYNNKLYYRGKGGDAGITAGVTIPLLKGLSCKPNISYSVPWGNLSDKNNGNQKNRFYSGMYLSYAF